MFELLPDGKSALSTSQLILRIICVSAPVALVDIHAELKRRYRVSVTYQAVRKAVLKLESLGVVFREGKLCTPSEKWLLGGRAELDRLLACVRRGKAANNITERLGDGATSSYNLETLFETDTFWGDVLLSVCESLENGEGKTVESYAHYAWWMVINMGRETHLFSSLVKKRFAIKMLILDDSPLNKWAAGIYRQTGINVSVKKRMRLDDSVAFNLVGDTIIQVNFPENAMKNIRALYRDFKNIDEVTTARLSRLSHAPYKVRLSVIRNRTLADAVRSNFS